MVDSNQSSNGLHNSQVNSGVKSLVNKGLNLIKVSSENKAETMLLFSFFFLFVSNVNKKLREAQDTLKKYKDFCVLKIGTYLLISSVSKLVRHGDDHFFF